MISVLSHTLLMPNWEVFRTSFQHVGWDFFNFLGHGIGQLLKSRWFLKNYVGCKMRRSWGVALHVPSQRKESSWIKFSRKCHRLPWRVTGCWKKTLLTPCVDTKKEKQAAWWRNVVFWQLLCFPRHWENKGRISHVQITQQVFFC